MTLWLLRVFASVSPHAAPLTLLAGSSEPGSWDPVNQLATYGAIGTICVLLGIGWLVPRYAYQAVVVERDRLRVLVDQTTPLVARNSEVTAEAIALIHLMQARYAADRQDRYEQPERRGNGSGRRQAD